MSTLECTVKGFQFLLRGGTELTGSGTLESTPCPFTESRSRSLGALFQALGFFVGDDNLKTLTHTYEYTTHGNNSRRRLWERMRLDFPVPFRRQIMRWAPVVFAVFAALVPRGSALPREAQPADWVLRGGAVYTVDAARSWAEAVAVADGKLVYVGTSEGSEPFVGSATRIVELDGKMVLPGFHDSHVHPVSGGIELGQCSLNETETSDEVLAAVEAYAKEHADVPWILGGGWALPLFPPEGPNKADLDRIVSERPAYLVAADGHSAWVNSRALELAGVGKDTPDPPNGRIERDPVSGEPSGTFREAAMDLFREVLPEPTMEDHIEGLRRALGLANRFGITSLVECGSGKRYESNRVP
jgi:hypothetical protein